MRDNPSHTDGMDQDAFAARLAMLNAPQRIGLAISGGRDSMALLRLSADYASRTDVELVALTVDHGLRPEAAKEAAQVAAWCARLGVVHETLRWEGAKPSTGIQAAARAARYTLLIHAAARHDCGALLTAHTRDDQAETAFMRLARGAGANGLSAMNAETFVAAGPGAPLRLLRPLLDVARKAVTEYLASLGQDFIDDPSNDDAAFERVRVRALLASLGEQDLLSASALVETASKLKMAAVRLKAQEDRLFSALGGCFHGWGGVSLARWDVDAPGAEGLARRLIHAASGGAFSPDAQKAAAAAAQALESGAASLGGALVRRWRGRLFFFREPAALTGRAGVAPQALQPLGKVLLWDRRFIMRAAAGARDLAAGPMGTGAARFLGPRAHLFHGPLEALESLPGLFSGGELIGAPALPFMGGSRCAAKALTRERYLGEIVRFS